MSKKIQSKHLVEARGPEVEGLPLNELFEKRRHRYLMVNVIARRARDLNRGSRALVEMPLPHTLTELAIAEVKAVKLDLSRKQTSKVLVSLIKDE